MMINLFSNLYLIFEKKMEADTPFELSKKKIKAFTFYELSKKKETKIYSQIIPLSNKAFG